MRYRLFLYDYFVSVGCVAVNDFNLVAILDFNICVDKESAVCQRSKVSAVYFKAVLTSYVKVVERDVCRVFNDDSGIVKLAPAENVAPFCAYNRNSDSFISVGMIKRAADSRAV